MSQEKSLGRNSQGSYANSTRRKIVVGDERDALNDTHRNIINR